jgi:cytochrome b involved in lipid metabolism
LASSSQKPSNNNINNHQQYYYHQNQHGETPLFLGAGLLGALSAGAALTFMEQAKRRPGEKALVVDGHVKHGQLDNQPPPRPDLPTYTMEQVAEHSDEESMWFSFRGGVYDLTFFTLGHPGGTPVSQPYYTVFVVLFLLIGCPLNPRFDSFISQSLASAHGGRSRLGTVLGCVPSALSWTWYVLVIFSAFRT